MSYNIRLQNSDGKTIKFRKKHHLTGGTYEVGGCYEAWLSVTYNYSNHFYRIIPGGIRAIYGKTGEESIPILQAAIDELDDDIDDNYWKPTEGNVKQALKNLLELANRAPHGIWTGD